MRSCGGRERRLVRWRDSRPAPPRQPTFSPPFCVPFSFANMHLGGNSPFPSQGRKRRHPFRETTKAWDSWPAKETAANPRPNPLAPHMTACFCSKPRPLVGRQTGWAKKATLNQQQQPASSLGPGTQPRHLQIVDRRTRGRDVCLHQHTHAAVSLLLIVKLADEYRWTVILKPRPPLNQSGAAVCVCVVDRDSIPVLWNRASMQLALPCMSD